MKKFVPNPAYENAPFELGATPPIPGYIHLRFAIAIPAEVWTSKNRNALNEWIAQHSIPTYIEIEEHDITPKTVS